MRYNKKQKSIGQLKDDSVFLLNDVESTLHDKPIEKYIENQKYEQAVDECNKWRILIKTVVVRNITVLSKKNRYCPV